MFFAIVMVVVAAALHLLVGFPIGPAVVVSLVASGVLWIIWKLKWILLGILGLSALFGGDSGGEA